LDKRKGKKLDKEFINGIMSIMRKIGIIMIFLLNLKSSKERR